MTVKKRCLSLITGVLAAFLILTGGGTALTAAAAEKSSSEETAAVRNSATVYCGVDYSSVYSFSFFKRRHPNLEKYFGDDKAKYLKYYVTHGFRKGEKAKKNVAADAFEMIYTARAITKSKTAKKTDQIILVKNHELSFWYKKSSGVWKRRFKTYCGYGKNGLSANRHEGDKTTPIGSFPILLAFGTASKPATSMTWRQVTRNSYWSGERATYNTWVESTRHVSGEHLIDYYQYEYAMAIGFNRNPTVIGKGSAIFLHCKSYDHWSTAGCVSVTKRVMKRLLRYSHDGVYILIVPDRRKIAKY